MRRIRYGVAIVSLVLAAASAGCEVDFVGGKSFACEGEGIQSTCLAGYLCNLGRCVPAGQYDPPGQDTGARDVVEATPDVPPDVPAADVPEDVPDVPPPPTGGDPCETDVECEPQRTGLVCSAEKVCCESRCDSECRTCANAGSLGVCSDRAAGTACAGDGGEPACNECNGSGQCLAVEGRCGTCRQCTVPGGGTHAVCDVVAAGEDPFGDCGDSPACGGACSATGTCDFDAAAPANGQRCETCRECNFGFCVPRLPGAADETCGDESCGGVCAAGGQCTTEFAAPTTRCGTCHECDAAGRCLPLQEGSADSACNDPNPCGTTGFCDAAGACAIQPPGHVCAAQTCTGTTKTVWQCDASQVCVSEALSCDAYTCEATGGECRTRCHTNAPCATGFYCAAGSCTATLQRGTPCVEDVQCETGACVDGVCCDGPCGGPCEVCDGSGGAAVGTCAVAAGQNPLVDVTGAADSARDCDGQVDACDGVCVVTEGGGGACDYSGSAEGSCGTCKWCSPAATGDCVNRPTEPRWYDDCLGDTECGGSCEAGACVFAKLVGAPCGDGPCAVCTAERECGLAEPGADPKGLCPGSPECGGGCTAAGACGTFVADDTLCGGGGSPCFWCQEGNCVLIAREDTPPTLCGGGDDLCRARCTTSGACGLVVPPGASCDRVCHRCDGAGHCAFAFPDPADEPVAECAGDQECGAHCDPELGGCGAPAAEETVCGTGDGCSVCQDVAGRGRTCVARADTPPDVCTREGGAPECAGQCGSFGVCEWPGQEEWCGECHRCNGDGFCETASDEQVSIEDCTPDDPACAGACLGGSCSFAARDDRACGDALCRWCQAGVCQAVPDGQDPLGQCNTTDHPICGETCDGAGSCAPAPGPAHPDGPVECGNQGRPSDPCYWCEGGGCVSISGYVEDPFDRCEADQVCAAGACSTCGNGVFEAGEVCDPADPAHPCEGVCPSPDPCTLALALECRCVEIPVADPDDGSDGCCPPIDQRGLDPNCVRWATPFSLNPDLLNQAFTLTQLPAIDEATGTLYIGGRDTATPTPRSRIFALSPAGEKLWEVSTASTPAFEAAATTSPVLVEGRLYFGRGTWLVSVDVASRTTTEVVNLTPGLLKEPPVVASSGLLVVGTQDGIVRGINPVDGSTEWQYNTGAGSLTGPGTRAGQYVYWGAADTVHAIHLILLPTAPGAARCFSPPTNVAPGGVAPGLGGLYLADDNGAVYQVFTPGLEGIGCTAGHTDTGTIGGSVDATPVTLWDGTVLFGGHDRDDNPIAAVGLYAFESDLTDVVWSEAVGSHVSVTPAVGTGPDGELVYAALRLAAGVRILAIQSGLGGATQDLVWTHDYSVPGRPAAVIASALAIGTDGTLYFRTSDGSLNAIVTDSEGLAGSGFPKRHGDYGNTGNAP